MIPLTFVLLVLVSPTFSDSCVTYTFEEDYDFLFTNNTGLCTGMQAWDIKYYENIGLEDHNEHSATFIQPQATLSCVNSFPFPVANGGTIEVNIFMETEVSADQIMVLAMEDTQGGNDAVLGTIGNSPALGASFVVGWHTLIIPIIFSYEKVSYISIMGMASLSSTVLVDSFRYIPPDMDKNDCKIYPSSPITTTETTIETSTDTTTEITPESTTETIPITESTTETTPESTTETTIEPTAEHTIEFTTEITAETTNVPITENTAISTTEIVTENAIDSESTTAPTPIITDENTESLVTQTTELPTTAPVLDEANNSFWTPLRIKILVALSIFILFMILMCIFCYCCCRANPQVSVIVVRS